MTGWKVMLAISTAIAWQTGSTDQAWSTSLFRCVTDDDQIVYTDTPTQLQQCAPIPTSGSVSSLATTSSGAPMSMPPPDLTPPPPAFSQPQGAQTAEGASGTFAGGQAHDSPTSRPCPAGINPLNPFTNPPCPGPETASPSLSLVPPMPGTPPTVHER
jgi:hypothetical protein